MGDTTPDERDVPDGATPVDAEVTPTAAYAEPAGRVPREITIGTIIAEEVAAAGLAESPAAIDAIGHMLHQMMMVAADAEVPEGTPDSRPDFGAIIVKPAHAADIRRMIKAKIASLAQAGQAPGTGQEGA